MAVYENLDFLDFNPATVEYNAIQVYVLEDGAVCLRFTNNDQDICEFALNVNDNEVVTINGISGEIKAELTFD